jgi:hypothetical protein
MTRIAAALLIVLTGLALEGGLGRPAFADSLTVKRPPGVEITQPLAIRSGRILTLLLTLEALRQVPLPLNQQKG